MLLPWNLDQEQNLTREKRQRQFDNEAILANCDIIVVFPIYG